MKKYGFALIGCGAIARLHAQAILNIENAELVAVYDNFYEFAEKFANEHKAKAYKTIEELLNDESVDIVNICTPSGLHAEIAVKIANAKKYIIVEKPMAITEEQLSVMIRAVEENGVKCEVVTQLRFSDAVQKIKKALNENKLGRILTADFKMKYLRTQEYYDKGAWRGTWKMDGGGALMNQGIHGIDLIQYLMGGVKSVQADCRTLARKIEVEDTANLLVEYSNGAVGVIQCTTVCNPGYPRTLEICGEKGTIVLKEDKIDVWDIEGESKAENNSVSDMKAFANPMDIAYQYHKLQFEDLMRAIEKDERPLVDIYEGKKPVDIILAAYESSKNAGKKIELE